MQYTVLTDLKAVTANATETSKRSQRINNLQASKKVPT